MRITSVRHFRPANLDGQTLSLEAFVVSGDHVMEGVLRRSDGRWIPIIDGVPSFLPASLQQDLSAFAAKHGLKLPSAYVATAISEQAKTNETFSDKWTRFKTYGLASQHQTFLFEWYRKKLGLKDHEALKAFYAGKLRILECGPGSGFNARFMAQQTDGDVFALDVSAAAMTTFENTRELKNCIVIQADLMDAPFPDSYFDFIIADGVIHHTPDTRAAVEALYRKLAPGGQFFFYIYRRMGASRTFTDNHIRSHFTQMTPDECYAACEALTDLGRELSNLDAKITLEKPIEILGIPAGTHDVQRLIYYNWVKCFWNDAFDYETNNMVNFDWYHPHNAWQHSQEEVESWLSELGPVKWQFNDANPNGLSVLLTKPE